MMEKYSEEKNIHNSTLDKMSELTKDYESKYSALMKELINNIKESLEGNWVETHSSIIKYYFHVVKVLEINKSDKDIPVTVKYDRLIEINESSKEIKTYLSEGSKCVSSIRCFWVVSYEDVEKKLKELLN